MHSLRAETCDFINDSLNCWNITVRRGQDFVLEVYLTIPTSVDRYGFRMSFRTMFSEFFSEKWGGTKLSSWDLYITSEDKHHDITKHSRRRTG